jgi:hypothetical protein
MMKFKERHRPSAKERRFRRLAEGLGFLARLSQWKNHRLMIPREYPLARTADFPITTQSLRGGGKRVGVKELKGVARALRKGSTDNEVFVSIEGILETIRDALVTPHPDPLPQGERGDNF